MIKKLIGVMFTAACLAALVLNDGSVFASSRAGRDAALDSIVQVIVQTRFGTTRRCSGYMFSTNGYVVTPFHVVSDAEAVSVFHADHGVFRLARVRRIDRRADIAVLATSEVDRPNYGGARVGDWRTMKRGDKVKVLHHPAYGDTVECSADVTAIGYPAQIAPGIASGYAPDISLIELAGPFDVGSTGGLVLAEDNSVVGMLIAGEAGTSGPRAYAVTSTHLASMMLSTVDFKLADLRTNYQSDQEYFDKFFGPAAAQPDVNGPMPEGYLAWFAPTPHADYSDIGFTNEINDKVDKNWFSSTNLVIDGRAVNEWSASRFFIVPATVNPWSTGDANDRYVHFDADSKFSKIIYKSKETEERIMTRYILAMPLAKGSHTLVYENRGANYKATGMRRMRFTLASAEIKLLDITGLSWVSLTLLPSAPAGAGEGAAVRYEVERKPYKDKELNWSVRRARFELKP